MDALLSNGLRQKLRIISLTEEEHEGKPKAKARFITDHDAGLKPRSFTNPATQDGTTTDLRVKGIVLRNLLA